MATVLELKSLITPKTMLLDPRLQIGGRHPALAQLQTELSSDSVTPIDITLSAGWCDISLLTSLALTLQDFAENRRHVTIDVSQLDQRRLDFLWKIGFFQTVTAGLRGEEFVRFTPAVPAMPTEIDARLNYTPIVTKSLTGKNRSAESVFESWHESFRSMHISSAIEKTDLIQSGELFFILVWELLQNALDHSKSRYVGVAAQVFVPEEWETAAELSPEATASLASQYHREMTMSSIATRREWIAANRRSPFALISLVDTGIGIPASVKAQNKAKRLTDTTALRNAFDPDFSTRRLDPKFYDVHGLSQALRIVDEYGGYLFVQSGMGRARKLPGTDLVARTVSAEERLLGTIFQILLPMHRADSSALVSTTYRVTSLKAQGNHYTHTRPLSLINELAAFSEDVVQRDDKWPAFVEHLVSQHERQGGGTLFIDLVCCPPTRQFLSFIVRALRKRFFFEGVVVLNASAHVYALVQSFLRARDEFKDVAVFEQHANERAELEVMCNDLATALSRGRMNYALSLLLPITRVAVATGAIQITWLGLTGIEKSIANRMAWIMSYLFTSGEALGIDDLVELSLAAAPRGEPIDEAALKFVLRNTVVVNPSLLATTSGKLKTTITIDAVRELSFGSLHKSVADQIVPQALHTPPPKEKAFLYHLGWDYETARYRKAYYEVWRALSKPEDLFVCVELLLRLVFDGLDERFSQVRAIVSVTPTAGLIGREIAMRLGIDFWEVPSVLELQGSPWIPAFPKNTAVLVACDLIDTGALTEKIVREIEDARSGKVLAVISLARDHRSQLPARLRGIPIVTAVDVDLGRPSKAEVERAERDAAFYEVDPHTLRPMPVAPHDEARLMNLQQRVAPLVAAGAVEIGHFIQGEHHYSSYFNLRAALRADSPLWRSIYEWASHEIAGLARRRKSKQLIVVYPYYSAVYLLINILRREGIIDLGASTVIRYAVAKPARRGGSVLAYSIEYDTAGDARGADIVILDDAVVTGATTAALVDEGLRNGARSILALAVVDRIGLRPRRHLRYIRTFRTRASGEALFDYRSFVDINMMTHDARNCRYCIVASDVTRNCSVNGLTEQTHGALESLLKPHLRGPLTRGATAGLSAEETLAYVVVADALHCEPPSSRQIIHLLERHVPTERVRLLLIRDLLQDVALDRQIAYKRNFDALLKRAFSAPELNEVSRATFLLHIPHFVRAQYASELLFTMMPSLYNKLAAHVAKGQAIPDPSLDGYFSRRPLEFAALSVALTTLRNLQPSYKLDENSLGEWRKQFSLSKEAPAYSSIYYFELRQTFVQAQIRTVEKAKLLIYNFLGSYSGHPEAYHYRLHTFLGFVINKQYEKAKMALPGALFKNLLASIATIQRELLSDNPTDAVFSDGTLVALSDAYDGNCTPQGAGSLVELFHEHFVSRQPRIQPATISRLLRELAPNVYDVTTDAINAFNGMLKRWDLADADILTVVRDLKRTDHVFCPKYLLQRTILHLLRNPIENKLGLRLTDPGARSKRAAIDGLQIELRLWVNESDKTWLLIDVTDNSEPDMPPEDTLHQAGGLSAQAAELKSVGNELLPSRLSDGRNLFRIRLQRVHVNQIAFPTS